MVITIADSIGICILHKNAVLAAIGNELHLYRSPIKDSTDGEQCSKLHDIRLEGKVHGIVASRPGADSNNARRVLVYGEMEFMLLAWTEPEYKFQLLHHANLSDWINAAAFLEDSEQEFVLHMAHSVVIRFGYAGEQLNFLERKSCTDKSTLYSSHIHGNRWKDLVIFSGNAFGELLIWQPANKSTTAEGKCTLLQRLSAHNGVIFSIDYNASSQLLTTTSDDRSIKFWRVDATSVVHNWSLTKLQPLCSAFGHTSRVFSGGIIEQAGQYFGITMGEDSYVCLWRTNGELLYKRRHHFGSTIWNYAYDTCTQTLYTVCATGKIIAYGLQDMLDQTEQKRIHGRILAPTNNAYGLASDEYISKIKFLRHHGVLVVVTNKNRLLHATLEQQRQSEILAAWREIDDFGRYKCTMLAVDATQLVLCGYKRITLYNYTVGTNPAESPQQSSSFRKLYDGAVLEGAIRSFHFLGASTYLACDEHGNCLLLEGDQLEKRVKIELPACKEPWLTAALLMNFADDESYLLTCNRHGNFSLYMGSRTKGFVYRQKLGQPHGYLGATCMRLQKTTQTEIFVQSAGHDGALAVICLQRRNGRMDLYTRESVPVAWIEQIVAECDLLLGFNDNRFVAWSQMHDFHMELPCGGGHRCWDFYLHHDVKVNTYWLQVVFIKNKKIVFHKCKLYNECRSEIQLPERNSWHVRACNVLRLLSSARYGPIIVSAGDDNLIKISTLSSDQRRLLLQVKVHTHISNIRSMRLWPELGEKCLIFSGGGRAQLCITRLHTQCGINAQQLCNYTLEPLAKVQASNREFKCNGETRIMCIDVARVSDHYDVYLACSDGYLRQMTWQPNRDLRQQQMVLKQAVHFGFCLLQVRLVAGFLLIGGTSGKLYVHSVADLDTPLLEVPMHASGINVLDVLQDSVLHILTGGDDQNVVYMQLDVSDDNAPRLLWQQQLPQLHNAQVTAAVLRWQLRFRTEDEKDNALTAYHLYAYTSGVDQRLRVYNLSLQRLEDNFKSCVADIKGLSMDAQQRWYVYGCGLQVIQKIKR